MSTSERFSAPSQFSSPITQVVRKNRFGHPGAVIWFTGLSGSGKSTLAIGLEALLHEQRITTFILDGDHLRQGLCVDLGFSADDRAENIRRAGEVATLFAETGFVALCALISPFQADRKRVREACHHRKIPFMEVFVDAPLAVCEERDPRGLYAKARRGQIPHFTGIDSPYECPKQAELHVLTHQISRDQAVQKLYSVVMPWLRDGSFQT